MPFYNDPLTPRNYDSAIQDPLESSWWLFDINRVGERHVPWIKLRIPSAGGGSCRWFREVAVYRSAWTPELLMEVVSAVDANPSAIWEDEDTETRFWTVWSRNERFGVDDPAFQRCMSHIKKQVRNAPPTGTPIVTVQKFIFSAENQRAIEHLRRALASRHQDEIEAGVQAYGTKCRALYGYVNNCYANNPALKWLSRQFVLKALCLDNDLSRPQTIAAAAEFDAWTEYLDSTIGRLDEYHDVKAPLKPDFHMNSPTSRLHPPRSILSKTENDYERNDAPNPRLPTSPHHPSQQLTNERNPRPSSSPLRNPSASVHAPTPDAIVRDNVDPRARPEIVDDRERPHARGVVTRVYQGVAVHSEPFELVAVKILTVTEIDRDATLQAWARDEHIRAQLKAREATLGAIAYPSRGMGEYPENVPIIVSPWCHDGNLREYVLARRALEPQRPPRRIILDVMTELLRIVSILHGQDPPIVHGNLKASNVLVSGGKLKLCDFGAYSEDDRDPLSVAQHGIIMHKSMPFMSPELLESMRPTVHSDMWAISCVFLEVHLAALLPNQDFATWTQDSFGRPLCPLSIGGPLKGLITANWDMEPTQRLSASAMHARLVSMRAPGRL